MKKEITSPCQHTDKDGYVLIVKCLNRDGTSHNGFVWPKAGPVENKHWSREPNCESGGLFGWPFGLGIGDGKDADACAPWLVFRAKPENVIEIGAKCKAVPGDNGDLPEVVYYGNMGGAMALTMGERVKYITDRSRGSASATGDRGSASATGDSGSASATGYRGSASATGYRGSASATGDRGGASATGYSGSASATGDRGSASATGDSGSASATGDRGSASATGYSGSASATGYRGSASATGDRGSASATGSSGSASATGEQGCAIAVGIEGRAQGAKGSWLTISEWKIIDSKWQRIDVQTKRVDGKKIKANKPYVLKRGKFVEVK
jgi:hypothetical protein